MKLLIKPREIENVEEFWERLKQVDGAVEAVIDEEVPLAKPNPRH